LPLDLARFESCDDGTYEWYLGGYDFLVEHWNRICKYDNCDLRELPHILITVRKMMLRAWDRKVGNPIAT